MLKLSRTTHVLFMNSNPDRGWNYAGWNGLNNALSALAFRLGEGHSADPVRTLDALRTLEERGYITPSDTNEDAYWIIEKAIPKEYRQAVWDDKMTVEEVLKVLKV